MKRHEIIVGNIGKVYDGNDGEEARKNFVHYRELSQNSNGRASGENVTWLVDGEVYKEYDAGN
jgi:hypothetical protein